MYRWNFLDRCLERRYKALVASPPPVCRVRGVVTHLMGTVVEGSGCKAPMGACCWIVDHKGNKQLAEVIGFERDRFFLMPYADIVGIASGDSILATMHDYTFPIGPELLGRVLNGMGQPMDGGAPISSEKWCSLHATAFNPLGRKAVSEVLDVGVSAINLCMTIGKGQRMGLFAGSGVGKSVLLSMITRFTKADVIVVGLIGERGREVKEFIEHHLGTEGLKRSVVVAAPADCTPIQRINAAYTAMSVAEYFRDQGQDVLLLVDSLTRFAHAQRELGLALGEPPATKGYPPSVFAKIAQFVERSGNHAGEGTMTAIYTVLADGDDIQDPVVDSARAILDGHIILKRSLAERGHYPAIDVTASISRCMIDIVSEKARVNAQLFRKYYSILMENQDILAVGAYTKGVDADLDWAVSHRTELLDFFSQGVDNRPSFSDNAVRLEALLCS
jgi:flagellum-specific ATP synthase